MYVCVCVCVHACVEGQLLPSDPDYLCVCVCVSVRMYVHVKITLHGPYSSEYTPLPDSDT